MADPAAAAPRRPNPLFAGVVRPIQEFFRLEAASGVVLLVTAVLALLAANSPLEQAYRTLLEFPLQLGAGGASVTFSLQELVNDGLMTVFFFVVGMEIKRELVVGELRTPARALLPAVAALGGMVVPGLIFFLINRGGPGQQGWGIPMATDIAFCVGVLTLLRAHVANGLKVFLTALAVFDDLGGIVVIALFYGHGVELPWLGLSAVLLAVLFGLNRRYARSGFIWAAAGLALWYALGKGGVHPTISGVFLGMAIPALPPRSLRDTLRALHDHVSQLVARPADEDLEAAEVLSIEEHLEDVEAPLTRFVHLLHPMVAFGVMPVFAFVNSGVRLGTGAAGTLWSAVPMGAALGLFLGKQIGIFLTTFAAVKLRLAPMPGGAPLYKLYGVAIVGGIGFTVALFMAQLSYPGHAELLDLAKIGILAGSLVSGVVGFLFLRFSGRVPASQAPADSS
ncbi:MAG TPA: Na+/H+ antiporter NhaA [Myxococcaceae bacterium]|jgi:NhaA family Na+:H+ antiporter